MPKEDGDKLPRNHNKKLPSMAEAPTGGLSTLIVPVGSRFINLMTFRLSTGIAKFPTLSNILYELS